MRVIDDFRDLNAWKAGASDEVKAEVVRAPRSAGAAGGLCLRYDFGRVSGYAVLRRALPIEFPANFALVLQLRGHGAPNAFQFKLVDASGDNVWWSNRSAYVPPRKSSDLVIRKRQIDFAWGPASDRSLGRTAAIELVVASGEGGRGELCFERLALRTLPPPGPLPPVLASASVASAQAGHALDGKPDTAWRSERGGAQAWQADLGAPREINGLLLRWADGARASDFDVQFSDDGKRWHTVRRVRDSARDVVPLWLPESETRHVRLALQRGPQAGYALAELRPIGPSEWSTPNDALRALALVAPRGRYPRAFVGEQNYWTLVGVDRRRRERGIDLRRRRDRAAQGGAFDRALRHRRGGPPVELGRRADRACAARRLPAAAAGALDRQRLQARDRGRRRRRARACAAHRALHAHQHRHAAAHVDAGARAAAVAGESADAIAEHRGRRQRGAPRRLARQHAARGRPRLAARRDAAEHGRRCRVRSRRRARARAARRAAAARRARRSAGPCERGAALASRARAGRVAQHRDRAADGRRAAMPFAPMRPRGSMRSPMRGAAGSIASRSACRPRRSRSPTRCAARSRRS